MLDHLDERDAMHQRHSEAGSRALSDAVRAAVAAAIPANATEDDVRRAWRQAGGGRMMAMGQLVIADDAHGMAERQHRETSTPTRETFGGVVTRNEREMRRKARG